MRDFEVAFLGATGSCAYNNGSRAKYGTNTICAAVRVGDDTLIFDAGTGICSFGRFAEFQREHTHLFLSHYHTDHIGGLLFFPQFFDKQKRFDVYGPSDGEADCRSVVNSFLSPPLHPVGINEFGANVNFYTIKPGCAMRISDDVAIQTYGLSHPGGAIGYRVEYGGKVFCYCVDVELGNHKNDAGLLEFTRDADLLVLDGFFDDGKIIPGWGHSSWKECAEWAKRADAKKLALFHHSFGLTDAEIDKVEKKAQEIFPDTFAVADFIRVML